MSQRANVGTAVRPAKHPPIIFMSQHQSAGMRDFTIRPHFRAVRPHSHTYFLLCGENAQREISMIGLNLRTVLAIAIATSSLLVAAGASAHDDERCERERDPEPYEHRQHYESSVRWQRH